MASRKKTAKAAVRRRLDRDRVVLEAAAICDEIGIEKLSLALLARQLGVRPPSLYNHVENLDDVYNQMTLMGARLWTEAVQQALAAARPAQRVRAIARATRAFALAHPTLFLCATRNFSLHHDEYVAAGAPLMEITTEVFRGLTHSRARADRAQYLMRCLIYGFLALEAQDALQPADDLDRLYDDLIRLAERAARS